ncbi:MAG: flagellar assembly protein FliW [Firmicutes bacterium]|nr:flagellar assembly protein FliW [Bacillota bacterium]
MQLQTTRFGQIAIDPELIFSFPAGIPGFPEERQFVLLSIGLEDTPFIWMQSIANADLCFLLVNPYAAFNQYAVSLTDGEAEQLQLAPGDEAHVLCMVSVPNGDLRQATVNLKAPLWFNRQKKLALQTIIDNEAYSIRHPLFAKGGE